MIELIGGVTPEMLREYEAHINQTLKERGELWVMAALFYGSIGYYTPNKSEQLLRQWKAGERECWSERCYSVFGCSSALMIEMDIRRFEACSQMEQEETMRRVDALRGGDWISQITASMMEPTRCGGKQHGVLD